MKFRIKQITYLDNCEYIPQVKKWYGWVSIGYGGYLLGTEPADTCQAALRRINSYKCRKAKKSTSIITVK